ncbi:hypothetical protein ACWEPM_24530 [Streptomyces sp. NPDC004244]
MGARGVQMGTRFHASDETQVSQAWKTRVVESAASDAVRVGGGEQILRRRSTAPAVPGSPAACALPGGHAA